jgi:hypothetical protein
MSQVNINNFADYFASSAQLTKSPSYYRKVAGFRKGLEDNPGFAQKVLQAASSLLASNGEEKLASFVAQASLKASEPRFRKVALSVYSDVCGACKTHDSLQRVKTASSWLTDLASGVGNLAKGVGYTSVLGGSGLGALYWLLSRHSRQGSADLEALEQQSDYYHKLNKRIRDRLANRFNNSLGEPILDAGGKSSFDNV